jgi:hypothetical protein
MISTNAFSFQCDTTYYVSGAVSDDDYVAHWYLQNNLFRGGSFTCSINHSGNGTSGMAYDNLFDRTAISGGGSAFTNGYNAYVTTSIRL